MANNPLKVTTPFPPMFKPEVQCDGRIKHEKQKPVRNGFTSFMDESDLSDQEETNSKRNRTHSKRNGHSSSNGTHLNSNGERSPRNNSSLVFKDTFGQDVNSVPVLSTLQCTPSVCTYIKAASKVLTACRKSVLCQQHKLEIEEFEQYSEHLNNVFDLYDVSEVISESSDDCEY